MDYLATLYPRPPYNFDLLLSILARYAHPVTDIVSDSAFWRVLRCEDALFLVKVTSSGTTESPRLEVHIADSSAKIPSDLLLAQVSHLLGMEHDLMPFYEFARSDADLWSVVGPLYGLPHQRTESVFEAIMLTIIEQQIAWTAAQRGQRWLVEWANEAVHYAGQPFYAFPTPEQIANTTVEMLTPLKITFKRMGVMIDIAREVAFGLLDLEALRDKTPEEMYRSLVKIKGIGHWTAVWTLTRTFGAQNYVGVNDVALQAAVNHYFYGQAGRASLDRVHETYARYGQWGGMSAYYTLLRWVYDRYPARPVQNASF